MPFLPFRSRMFKLDGHEVVACDDEMDWAMWNFGPDQNRHVGDETVDGYRVSTVFLGWVHGIAEGPPLLFETMIFSPEGAPYALDRYCTWEEAEAGHARMLQLLREELERTSGEAQTVVAELVQRLRAT